MSSSRYSDSEMQQWQDACPNPMACDNAASRHNSTRASAAKGQADQKQTRTAYAAAQDPWHKDSASECLFDCYNG
ncbi:MAG: hypothetical protein IT331_03685 [Anaerolineae bacterium]|nr:hypothetical protein [Anaerolineae bacterium]